jgi:hypothetical protein
VPQYCWLVVVLGQNERCHGWSDAQQFYFCCMTLDRRVRKRFRNDLLSRFWQKGAPTLDLEKNRGETFLHEYIKLEGRSWRNALLSTSSVHCASQNSNGYCLVHPKLAPQFHFLKMTLCQLCGVKLHASFSQVSQFRKLSQLIVKKKHLRVDLLR